MLHLYCLLKRDPASFYYSEILYLCIFTHFHPSIRTNGYHSNPIIYNECKFNVNLIVFCKKIAHTFRHKQTLIDDRSNCGYYVKFPFFCRINPNNIDPIKKGGSRLTPVSTFFYSSILSTGMISTLIFRIR